jgi:hypothetical protein
MAGGWIVRSLLVSPISVLFFTCHTRFKMIGDADLFFFFLLLVFTQRGLAFSVMSLIVLIILIVGAAKGAASI